MTFNSTNTKYMIAGGDNSTPSGVSAEVVMDGYVLRVVEEFVFRGMLETCDNTVP